ncbi:hypothetical protein GEMRC1_011071 [Eukaryota sp. GEM-RC1]
MKTFDLPQINFSNFQFFSDFRFDDLDLLKLSLLTQYSLNVDDVVFPNQCLVSFQSQLSWINSHLPDFLNLLQSNVDFDVTQEIPIDLSVPSSSNSLEFSRSLIVPSSRYPINLTGKLTLISTSSLDKCIKSITPLQQFSHLCFKKIKVKKSVLQAKLSFPTLFAIVGNSYESSFKIDCPGQKSFTQSGQKSFSFIVPWEGDLEVDITCATIEHSLLIIKTNKPIVWRTM